MRKSFSIVKCNLREAPFITFRSVVLFKKLLLCLLTVVTLLIQPFRLKAGRYEDKGGFRFQRVKNNGGAYSTGAKRLVFKLLQ